MIDSQKLRMLLVSAALLLTACQSVGVHGHDVPVTNPPQGAPASSAEIRETGRRAEVVALGAPVDVKALSARIKNYPVIFVGETHDRYGDHLGQLEIIKGLVEEGVELAIGMEMFQQPYQGALDDYIAGRISEREMLEGTQWFERWVYDYRLYRPILTYAREQRIPVVALNIEKEIIGRVSAVGIEGLTADERGRLPPVFSGYDNEHLDRLKQIFASHASADMGDFDRFLQVQESWDQGMAWRAREYLAENPGRSMVVLAGSGHLMFDAGIPRRVEEYINAQTVVILPGDNTQVRPGIADFIIYPGEAELPKKGVMGVFLGESELGVEVKKVVEQSAAEAAGIQEEDIIQQIDGLDVRTPGELKAALLGRAPGDRVSVRLLRKHLLRDDELIEVEFALGE